MNIIYYGKIGCRNDSRWIVQIYSVVLYVQHISKSYQHSYYTDGDQVENAMTQHLIFKGQNVEYNPDTKTALVTIDKPYVNAGKDLGWDENVPGIGLNLEILTFILQRNATLMIKVLRNPNDSMNGHLYWIPSDTLKDFLKNYQCTKIKSGVELRVIKWKKFIRYVEHGSL